MLPPPSVIAVKLIGQTVTRGTCWGLEKPKNQRQGLDMPNEFSEY